MDENIDKSVLHCFGHRERMGRDEISKMVYGKECMGCRFLDRPWKKWIDSVTECLKKRGLNVGQIKRN